MWVSWTQNVAVERCSATNVIPAQAGIQTLRPAAWIPGRASHRQLARNDGQIIQPFKIFRSLRVIRPELFIALLLAIGIRLANAGESRQAWQQEWEKTLQGAKTEGQVTVYVHSTYGPVLASGAFERAFPGIKLTVVSGIENDLERRFTAERRAGKNLADVFMVGVLRSYDFMQAKYLEPIKPILILPEVVDESKWWQGKHYYGDPEKKYLFRYVASAQYGQISYNTQLIQPKEFNSFWHFVNPKWKGKILARDIRLPGTGGSAIRLFYYHSDMGPEFVRKLFAETDITLFRDRRQGLDWLATGKYPICFWCEGVDKANSQGLPVDTFGRMKEGAGLSAGQATLTYVNQAPHPNAATLFINWFLSRDGQINFQKALGKADEGSPDSLRIDIPKDDVDPKSRRIDGVKYLDTDQWLAMKPVLKVVEEALAQAGKK
ncbi:MAG TPA: extracellular solute-binding protein [Candidatus Binatia bacterium]